MSPLWRTIADSFNPRTREGATVVKCDGISSNVVSIHAPVRVRLKAWLKAIGENRVSIHAPVRVRLLLGCGIRASELFQSTHP